jgi:hypothetical protein
MIKGLNVSPKELKLLLEKLEDISIDKSFLNKTDSNCSGSKNNIDKWDCIKLKKLHIK